MTEMYHKSSSLMKQVVTKENLILAAEKVRKNDGAPGVDGMTVQEVEHHIREYYPYIRKKLLNGTYQPQPVRRVEIPKGNGKTRKLGIPVVRDRVIQMAIKQVIEPVIDRQFSDSSHGFRPGKGTKTALKQCVEYYEDGLKHVVDCDLKQCFDTLNHDKMMYHVEQFVQDKAILKFIRKSLRCGTIELSGEFTDSETGAPQGGVISPLLCNIYLNELDKELERRGHKFVRYADDFIIFKSSKRACERILKSITQFIEKDLKLQVNQEKSKTGSPTQLKFLSCLIHNNFGNCRFRPTDESKAKFKKKLKRLTKRNRPGIFAEIVKEINQVTQGWINYFGLGFVKSFVRRTEEWLRRRLRQLILKRWKKCSTKIKMLQKYGLTEDEAKRIAFSRKAYWHLSQTYEVNKAITTKRLHKWGLKSLTTIAESAYARY
ncbi:group II intron reverse transcriptase/maturase [Dolosigranulum pigrum]|uniref:group II intron reverse transcriptase/maturase n=1 Tax=Dolosigranulum pigrum TaxID=29394 RepID=UPI001FCB11B3|nr:group II intron reverse transcriptase/maturase [Dolosigranulum pigrum]